MKLDSRHLDGYSWVNKER